ncbi:Unknown protein, partial [Striga hermonthica]
SRFPLASPALARPARPACPSPAAPRVPPVPEVRSSIAQPRAPVVPHVSPTSSSSPATPMPIRIRHPPALLVLARPSRASPQLAIHRASRPLTRLPTSSPTYVPSLGTPPYSCAALAQPVLPVSSPHPIALAPSRTRSFGHPRASWHDARHTPDNRSSSILWSLAPVGSPDGHGSHPSNPMQSPALQIHPSSIRLLPPFRATILRTPLFLAQGLHLHFSSFAFA